jgi:hypothetical protein
MSGNKNNKSSSDKNSLELAIKVLLNVGHWCSITNSYASSKHPCVTTCSVPETSIHTISPSIKIIQIELRWIITSKKLLVTVSHFRKQLVNDIIPSHKCRSTPCSTKGPLYFWWNTISNDRRGESDQKRRVYRLKAHFLLHWLIPIKKFLFTRTQFFCSNYI